MAGRLLLDMLFESTKGGLGRRGLVESTMRGLPGPRGLFSPEGEASLSQAVYAPDASFVEAAAFALAALFPEDLDPFMAQRFAEKAFSLEPASFDLGTGIVVSDFASGPSGSVADYEASLLAAILDERSRRDEERVVLASADSPIGAALAEALAGIKGIRLVLLGGDGPIRGIRASRLAREGGNLFLVAIGNRGREGGGSSSLALLRRVAGSGPPGEEPRLAGLPLVLAGPANPARLAARIVLYASTFGAFRLGASGELILALDRGDELGLASGLWAWRFGLPLSGFLLPGTEVEPEAAADYEARETAELVEGLERDSPGLLRSVLRYAGGEEGRAGSTARDSQPPGCPLFGSVSLRTFAAATKSLEGSMSGHARILVPRSGLPFWTDGPDAAPLPGALRDPRPDIEIGEDLADLEAALARLF
jgi:hypothetical protein